MPYDLFFPPKSITASSSQGDVGMVCAIDISSLPSYARNPVPVETSGALSSKPRQPVLLQRRWMHPS